MGTDVAIERVRNELMRAFDNTRAELERIEILVAGLAAFGTPVPNYEPTFRHLHHLNLDAHELAPDKPRT